jgi:hypothetical protein
MHQAVHSQLAGSAGAPLTDVNDPLRDRGEKRLDPGYEIRIAAGHDCQSSGLDG